MLSVTFLSGITLIVIVECNYAECNLSDCHYTDCSAATFKPCHVLNISNEIILTDIVILKCFKVRLKFKKIVLNVIILYAFVQ
jgi:hypothetical protein